MKPTYAIAHAAGLDSGNRSARTAGRKKWSRADFDAAARMFDTICPAVELEQTREFRMAQLAEARGRGRFYIAERGHGK